jgi:hypothetical protein
MEQFPYVEQDTDAHPQRRHLDWAERALPAASGYASDMDDRQLLHLINEYAEEEERLWSRASGEGGLTAEDEARLHALQVRLDQAYDLLNQRRARRAAGLNPDEAHVRPPEVVENYQQ